MHAGFGGRLSGKGPGSCGMNTGPRRTAHPTCDPGARYEELGPDYYSPRSPARQTRDKIRDIERLNPGKKVILIDAGPQAAAVT